MNLASVKTWWSGRSPFRRGEALAGTLGAPVAAILIVACTFSWWWSLHSRDAMLDRAAQQHVSGIAQMIANSASELIEADDLTSLRRFVLETSRQNELTYCRVSIGAGQIVADAEAPLITTWELPPTWTLGAPEAAVIESLDDQIITTVPFDVRGRGKALLKLSAPAQVNAASFVNLEMGLAAATLAALGSLLLVYHRVRTRFQAISHVRDALFAIADGEKETDALHIDQELGPEATAWNTLVEEREQYRRQLTVQNAVQTVRSAGDETAGLSAACDALPQGMLVIDDGKRVSYANGAAAVYLQKPREEVAGANFDGLVEVESIQQAVDQLISGQSRQRNIIEIERGENGSDCVLRFVVRPVRRGDSAEAMIIIEDITQQRVAEQSRHAFVSHVTHELRTPLTNIRLYTETAIDEGASDPAVLGNSLNVINQETRRLERVVGDMLSMAEIEAGARQLQQDDVRLEELIHQMEIDYAPQAEEKQVTLQFDLPPKMPVLVGDRDKINLGLHNLVGNALKYTPAEGTVRVEVAVEAEQIVVTVSDTGIGISEADVEHIFDRFYRANDKRIATITGSGLGLALAREVIRLHGGDITVESEIDQGSAFTMTLPVPAEAA